MIKVFLRKLYLRYVSQELRYWIYKFRNPVFFQELKFKAYPSEKGVFSLREFYKNECVFVHITKSAGTSLAFSLFGELPYHYTAQQYRVIYGRKDFNRFYKFTFVRNPWDRLYSSYSYLKGGGWDLNDQIWSQKNLNNIDSFEDFVINWLTVEKLGLHIHLWPQSNFICDNNGMPLVDYLGYFESINEDFSYVLEQLNLPLCELKHTNISKRQSYLDVYTDEMILKVKQIYFKDIDNFGYKFDNFHRVCIIDNRFVKS